MKTELRMELRKRSRTIKGLINLLQEDAKYICVDAEDVDLLGLNESIKELRDTLQSVIDNVMELEYTIYLTKQDSK